MMQGFCILKSLWILLFSVAIALGSNFAIGTITSLYCVKFSIFLVINVPFGVDSAIAVTVIVKAAVSG